MSSSRRKLLSLAVFAAVALGVLLIAGCGGDKGTGSKTGSISGTVFKANSPHPVFGVFVTCAGQSATTDINGVYNIDGLPLGKQTLSATKEEYEFFTTIVTISGSVTKDIFIVSSKGGGGGIGE